MGRADLGQDPVEPIALTGSLGRSTDPGQVLDRSAIALLLLGLDLGERLPLVYRDDVEGMVVLTGPGQGDPQAIGTAVRRGRYPGTFDITLVEEDLDQRDSRCRYGYWCVRRIILRLQRRRES